MSSGGGAEDIEIVVNKRKTLDESQALKLLSTFLDKDQEKKAEDQVCSYLCQSAPAACRRIAPLRICVVALSPSSSNQDPPSPFTCPHKNNNLIAYKPLLF
jgi:hypothetical protein